MARKAGISATLDARPAAALNAAAAHRGRGVPPRCRHPKAGRVTVRNGEFTTPKHKWVWTITDICGACHGVRVDPFDAAAYWTTWAALDRAKPSRRDGPEL